MKNIILAGVITLFALALNFSCSGPGEKQAVIDTTYTVTVDIKGLDSVAVILSYMQGEDVKTDTAKSLNGQYVFTGSVDEPKQSRLRIAGDKRSILPFYLENGKINIMATKDSLFDATVVGTRTNEESTMLKQGRAAVEQRSRAFSDAYHDAVVSSNKPQIDSLEKAYEAIEKDKNAITLGFIKEHPGSYVSLYEVRDMFVFSGDPNVGKFDSTFMLLDSALRASSFGTMIKGLLEIAKKTDINQMAPEFTLNDAKGTPVALASLRGKYILIDFWASWCGPCRRENPNLVKSYALYKKKGFDILGVSLDDEEDRDKWLEAIKKDKLTWLQVSDLKGWSSSAGQLYGINAIPMNFLLDPHGRIVAKGLRGADLDAKLEMLLNPAPGTSSN